MTDPKPKGKPEIPTRKPQKKTNSAIFDNLRQLPHPVEEFLNPAPGPTEPIPSHPDPTPPKPAQPIAAERDFNKRHNSIERSLSEGLFPGTSQKLYNPLFTRTRGAHKPTRYVKATKRELMAWSGIKSKNTIAVNLKILTTIGWLKVTVDPGDHDGNVYEVFVYEELTRPNPTQPKSPQLNPSEPGSTQKLGVDPTQKLGWVGSGEIVDSQRASEIPNTSSKTNTERTTDDEAAPHSSTEESSAFAKLLEILSKTSTEITGKSPSVVDRDKWAEVAEVLSTELKIAAGRTTVSSVPAFLAEHLRRRLWKKEKRQIEAEAVNLEPSTVRVKRDTSNCLDCFGTGMFYPEGFDKGVARCGHERLSKTGEEM